MCVEGGAMKVWSIITLVLVWIWFSVTVVAAIRLTMMRPDMAAGWMLGVWLLPVCFGVFAALQFRVVRDVFRGRRN